MFISSDAVGEIFGTDSVTAGSCSFGVGGAAGGLPSAGLDVGAARESGWANLRSLICLISYLGSPLLYLPTSIFNVDLDTLLCTLKGPS